MKRSTLSARALAARALTLLAISAGLLFPTAPPAARAAEKAPNILFILTDNLGYGELGVYGGGATRGAPTPRIDRLAAEGLRLTNMNMETQCTPSRSSLQTGRFAIRSGTYAVPFGGVPDGLTRWEVTIGEPLSAAGYATALYGKWHLGSGDGRLPNDQGYDEWYGIPRTTDEALWPSSPQWTDKVAPPEQILEGRKGEKSRWRNTVEEAGFRPAPPTTGVS
ncbi:MAG: sulfatase-like hydrolase/transferase [bacterium]